MENSDFQFLKNDAFAALGKAGSVVVSAASGDHYGGAPVIRVYVDDHFIGARSIAAAHNCGKTQTVELSYNLEVPPNTLRIEFPNDAPDAASGADRNLWIAAVGISGRRLSLEDAVYERVDGTKTRGQPEMFWSGALTFTFTP